MSILDNFTEPFELIMKNGDVYGKFNASLFEFNGECIFAEGEAPINRTDVIRCVKSGNSYLVISVNVGTFPNGVKATTANVIPYHMFKN